MNLADFIALMQTDMDAVMRFCEEQSPVKNIYDGINYTDPLREYNPEYHSVMSSDSRPDKIINGENGEFQSLQKVSRIPIPFQKKIVTTAVAFLGTPEVDANTKNEIEVRILQVVRDTWMRAKLDFKFSTIAEKVMSEKACAELWYTKQADETFPDDVDINSDKRLAMQILARSHGDSLYPVFDQFGDMIAFGRSYNVLDERAKPVQHFDVYSANEIWYSKQDANNLWLFGLPTPAGIVYTDQFVSIKNDFGNIPVIYYWQPTTEWHDVRWLIDRIEKKYSNLADTNDYFDSPIVLVSGEAVSFAQKGESGKMLELKNGSEVKYLTWDQAPEAMKFEIVEALRNIFTFTHTPDISFEKLIGLGYFSTVALKTLFTDAHFKAAKHVATTFGEGLQRRINFIRKALVGLDETLKPGLSLDIKPKFEFYLPKNVLEEVQVLASAVAAGILSVETAVTLNPLVADAVVELEKIKAEKQESIDQMQAAAPPAQKEENV